MKRNQLKELAFCLMMFANGKIEEAPERKETEEERKARAERHRKRRQRRKQGK